MKSSLTDHLLPSKNNCSADPKACCILPYSPLNIGAMSVIRSTIIPICNTATTDEGIAILNNNNNNNLNTSTSTTPTTATSGVRAGGGDHDNIIGDNGYNPNPTTNKNNNNKSTDNKKNSCSSSPKKRPKEKKKMGQLQLFPTLPKLGQNPEETDVSSSPSKDYCNNSASSPARATASSSYLDYYSDTESTILSNQSRLSPESNMGRELEPGEISVAKPLSGSKVFLSTSYNSSNLEGISAHYVEGDFDSAEEAMEELEFGTKNFKTSTRTPSPHSLGSESNRSASQSSLESSESQKVDVAYRHHTVSETNPTEYSMDYPIQVPIIGYETMEQRARFTVFKLQVIRSQQDSWFVFRRYTDFVILSDKLKNISPDFFIPLPPKRWFLDNFDRHFLEERRQGLQEFIDRILGSRTLCECGPVREFFCLDDPPGPHDSLEESRALCESLEEQTYNLKKELRDKEHEIDLLKSELNLYKSQIEDMKRIERLEINEKSTGQEINPANATSEGIDQSMNDCPEVDQNNFQETITKLETK